MRKKKKPSKVQCILSDCCGFSWQAPSHSPPSAQSAAYAASLCFLTPHSLAVSPWFCLTSLLAVW